MDPQDKGSQGPPLSIRFVPGRAKDGATQSLVRSHTMTAFRARQRRQKKLENEWNQKALIMNMASIRNNAEQFCQCLSVSMSSVATSSQSSERELPWNPLAGGHERCAQCGLVQLLRMSPSQHLGVLQQQYPAIATFAAAEFDPFGSMTELPQHLTSNYSQEINAIKRHGSYNLYLAAIISLQFPIARTVGCHEKLVSKSSTLARVIACLSLLSQRKDIC